MHDGVRFPSSGNTRRTAVEKNRRVFLPMVSHFFRRRRADAARTPRLSIRTGHNRVHLTQAASAFHEGTRVRWTSKIDGRGSGLASGSNYNFIALKRPSRFKVMAIAGLLAPDRSSRIGQTGEIRIPFLRLPG